MRTLTTLLLAASMLAAIPASATTTTNPRPPESEEIGHTKDTLSPFDRHMQAAMADMQAQDFTAARADLTAMQNDPEYATLTPAKKHAFLSLLAMVETFTGDSTAAYAHLTDAGPAVGDASDGAYDVAMIFAGGETGHKDQAIEAVIGLSKISPDSLTMLDLSYVLDLATYARQQKDGGALHLRFLEALWDAHYTPADPYWSAERVWFELFEAEVAAGNETRAHALVAGFTEPETVIRLKCDKRYAAYLTGNAKLGDFQAILDASIAHARDLMTAHPRDVEAVNNLAYRLANANRLDEALKLTDDVLTKVDAAPKDAPAFDDQKGKLQWIYMTRSLILERLGRTEDTLKTQEAARDSALAGGPSSDDVSQPINLGDQYYATGHPKEALDAVQNVDGHVSAYGQMAAMNVRACAYKQLGDTAKLAETMAYMKAHVDDGFSPYRNALMCTGDSDGLAAVLVQRLDDPVTRNQTLLWMQCYLTSPRTEFQKSLDAVGAKAESHADVQAAVARYGNIASYPVFKEID